MFVTHAVLLAAVSSGEADRVVTLYSREHGKLSAIAKGARKSRSRFGASLALFVAGEATLRDSRSGDLMLLERFDARADFTRLGEDVVKLAHASYATELLRELTVPRQPDAALYDLLLELYRIVMGYPAARGELARLRAPAPRRRAGLAAGPRTDRCLVCASEDDAVLDAEGALVDPGRGGLVCAACAAVVHFASDAIRRLPAAARAQLLALLRGPACSPTRWRWRRCRPRSRPRRGEAMHALVQTHLHAPMRSLEFIRQLRASLS